jgi:hypothetical protein
MTCTTSNYLIQYKHKDKQLKEAKMKKWLETLIEEKNIDMQALIEVEGNSGVNIMPLQMVVDAVVGAGKPEQAQIKNTLVKIDFMNGDIMHFFKHLAGALAI